MVKISDLDPNDPSILKTIEEARKKHTAKLLSPKSKSHWYELDGLMPYKDIFLAIGFVCVLIGVFSVSLPVGYIVLGTGLIRLSFMMAAR